MAKRQPKSRRKVYPRLGAMLLCDGIGKDHGSGKHTLYGLFDRLLVHEEPITARFIVFARLLGGRGFHDFSVNLASKRGKQILKVELGESKECKPGGKTDIFCQLGVELPSTGEYRIFVASGNKVIGKPLILQAIKADEADKTKDG